MPYKLQKNDSGEWCAIATDTGESKGCSKSRKMGLAHMRALYAAHGGAKMGKKALDSADNAADTFESAVQAYEKQYGETVPVDELQELAEIDQIVGGINATLFGAVKDQDKGNFISGVIDALKEIVNKLTKHTEPVVADTTAVVPSVMLWKEVDASGVEQYRWFARYSNNIRDSDSPPEIISAASHQRFVENVDKGLVKLPVLELWHVPEWKIGQATWVAYDNSGFAMAAGTIDGDNAYAKSIAEVLEHQSGLLMSHGMPISSIKRDPVDPTVIIEHETNELSVLPSWAAANKGTEFMLITGATKEASMAIPAEKRKALIEQLGITAEMLDQLESKNASDAEKAISEGRETKQVQVAETAVADTVVDTVVDAAPVTAPTVTVVDTTDYPTRKEVADAIVTVLGPYLEKIDAMAGTIDAINKELTALPILYATKTDDQARLKQQTELMQLTPAASLAAMIAQNFRAVGSEEAAVDGRSSLAKSKPKESAEQSGARIPIPFLNEMIYGANSGQ